MYVTKNVDLCISKNRHYSQALRQDARLLGDGCPAVELASMKVITDWSADGPIRGPVPILFARNPEEASNALMRNPERLTNGLR